jgi:hypothetical protein
VPTYDTAWSITAAITSIYAPAEPTLRTDPPHVTPVEEVADRAAAHGDEHVVKFTEVAVESHARGNRAALPAAQQARQLIPAP